MDPCYQCKFLLTSSSSLASWGDYLLKTATCSYSHSSASVAKAGCQHGLEPLAWTRARVALPRRFRFHVRLWLPVHITWLRSCTVAVSLGCGVVLGSRKRLDLVFGPSRGLDFWTEKWSTFWLQKIDARLSGDLFLKPLSRPVYGHKNGATEDDMNSHPSNRGIPCAARPRRLHSCM